MQKSTIAKLIIFLFLYILPINSALSRNTDDHLLSTELERSLNQKDNDSLKELFLKKSFKKFKTQYLDFKKRYKDPRWSIQALSNNSNNILLDIKITSSKEINDQVYNLNSKQIVKVKTFENKIKSYKIINEESILSSQDSPLVMKIISPDKVLTGEKYEINIIIEKPLDNALIASGMIVLKNNEKINMSNDQYGIKVTQSGGLFKFIQAPLRPGFQTISAIIMHPEGIYSMTKKIKVGL